MTYKNETTTFASKDNIKWLRQRALGRPVYQDVGVEEIDITVAKSLYHMISSIVFSPIDLLKILKEETPLPYETFKKIEDFLIS